MNPDLPAWRDALAGTLGKLDVAPVDGDAFAATATAEIVGGPVRQSCQRVATARRTAGTTSIANSSITAATLV
jgi:hypothetical protein